MQVVRASSELTIQGARPKKVGEGGSWVREMVRLTELA